MRRRFLNKYKKILFPLFVFVFLLGSSLIVANVFLKQPTQLRTRAAEPERQGIRPDSDYYNNWEQRLFSLSVGKKADPITDLKIEEAGGNLKLSWSRTKRAFFYKIYRSTEAWFSPSSETLIGYSIRPNYLDETPDLLGDPENNYFYLVRAFGPGGESEDSNRVGEFDFRLFPGKDNGIALPLMLVSPVPDADSLASYIGGVSKVCRFLSGSQSWQCRLPEVGFGTNFPLELGVFYLIKLDSTGPSVVTFVGGVPEPGTASFDLVGSTDEPKHNTLSIPLDKTNISDAAGLAADIGDVVRISTLDSSQGEDGKWRNYEPGNPTSENYPVRVGYPYLVVMQASKSWN